ncbi:MAG: GAF domain-containing protein [Campylobacterales bacterium]|nr:GAF domain-containing protein [Campylobacterales bacterium]
MMSFSTQNEEKLLSSEEIAILKKQSVNLNNCDREPIHIPGSIQPHGILIALETEHFKIVHVSENITDYFGGQANDYLGKSLTLLFRSEDVVRIKSHSNHLPHACCTLQEHLKVLWSTQECSEFFAMISKSANGLVILELQSTSLDKAIRIHPLEEMIHVALKASSEGEDMQSLYDAMVRTVQKFSGYDRVMVYRFDEAYNGSVVAESKPPHMESFLHSHYPSSDIPKQARLLYTKNYFRVIPDIYYTPSPIVPEYEANSGLPLDMSNVVLRSVSPVHIQYLKNMGTTASMSLSLIVEGQLWGMIACHHSSRRIVPFCMWKGYEALSAIFSKEVASRETLINNRNQFFLQNKAKHFQELFQERIRSRGVIEGIKESLPLLFGVCEADGVAAVIESDAQEQATLLLEGCTPNQEAVLEYLAAFAPQLQDGFFVTHQVPALAPHLLLHKEKGSGVMILQSREDPKTTFLCFRKEFVETILWAGNPLKSNISGEGEEQVIAPRHSFELWKQVEKEKSLPWSPLVCTLFKDFHAHLDEALLHHKQQIELIRLQKEHLLGEQLLLQQSKMAAIGEMISMIAHQWRQPLGAIGSSALDMDIKLDMEFFDLENALERDKCVTYFKESLNDISEFVKILTTTIDDFRNFYKLQSELKKERIEEPVIKALKIMNCYMVQDSINVQEHYESSASIKLYTSEIMQVVISILRNAQENFQIKETPNPRIRIRSYEDEQSVILELCDNGGGIPDALLNQIFDPYFTTKGANEGTGLGLHMSKTIIEVHHEGKMSAKNSDDGVCFVIELPKKRT